MISSGAEMSGENAKREKPKRSRKIQYDVHAGILKGHCASFVLMENRNSQFCPSTDTVLRLIPVENVFVCNVFDKRSYLA